MKLYSSNQKNEHKNFLFDHFSFTFNNNRYQHFLFPVLPQHYCIINFQEDFLEKIERKIPIFSRKIKFIYYIHFYKTV